MDHAKIFLSIVLLVIGIKHMMILFVSIKIQYIIAKKIFLLYNKIEKLL